MMKVMNSQILIANAWHHRSDAFSSILSLLSIAMAMLLPQFLFADAAGGILVAGMICLTGLEILFESVKQLTDTSDGDMLPEVSKVIEGVDGVIAVKQLRSRTVGSGHIVEATISTDAKLSATSAQSIAERVRWRVMQAMPGVVMEVSVKTRSTDPVCPLLSGHQRGVADVESDIFKVSSNSDESINRILKVRKVVVHYVNTLELSVEVLVSSINDFAATTEELRVAAEALKKNILANVSGVKHAEIHLVLSENSP